MNKFIIFLESIKNQSNAALVDVFTDGFKASNHLYENPDTVNLPDSVDALKWEDDDAIPFIYLDLKDKMYLDKNVMGKIHGSLMRKIAMGDPRYNENNLNEIQRDLGLIDDYRKTLGIHGRLWINHKVMSFWNYPSKEMFNNKIIPELKNAGIDVNNDWEIEVHQQNGSPILIPIDDYSGEFAPDKDKQAELDKMREWHTLTPIEKQKFKKRNIPGKQVDNDGKSMAEINFLRKELAGD